MQVPHPPARPQSWTDCDPDLAAFVTETSSLLAEILGSQLVGAYLHGSLAMGCYHRPKSDIDLLLVTDGPLSPAQRRAAAHAGAERAALRPTIGDLELSIVRADKVGSFTHPHPFEVHVGTSWLTRIRADEVDWALDHTDPDLAAHCAVTRQRGIALSGPPPADVIGPVPPEAYLEAILDDLAWILDGHHILQSPYYGVLNTCRVLKVLELGAETVVSKPEGADWALAHLPGVHRPIIEQALRCYRSAREVTEAERRTDGHGWDSQALLAFRAFAASETPGRVPYDPGP